MNVSGVFSSEKVAVITGGADGIGLACAQKLLGLGMQVCISDNNEEKLQQVSEQLPDVMTVPANVSQMTDIERLRDKVYARFGRVNVLMNNAGHRHVVGQGFVSVSSLSSRASPFVPVFWSFVLLSDCLPFLVRS